MTKTISTLSDFAGPRPPKNAPPKRRPNVTLPQNTHDHLRELSGKYNMPMSRVVETLIAIHYANEELLAEQA